MTFLHLALVVVGVLAALAASDLLHHRGIGRWPVGLASIALVLAGGFAYSASVSALALGSAIGCCALFGVDRVRELARTRRAYLETARERRERERRIVRAAHGREGL